MPFCTSCGKEIAADNKFCEYCGAPTGARAPPSPQLHEFPESQQQIAPLIPFGQQPLDPDEPVSLPGTVKENQVPESPEPSPAAVPSRLPVITKPPPPPLQLVNRNRNIAIVAVVIVVIISAAAVFALLQPALSSGTGVLPVSTPVPVPIPTTATTDPTTIVTTTVPIPPPDPFPDSYSLREWFTYNEGKYASKATVYRYWINETYHWHNDKDNHYYTEPQRLDPSYKYLLIYVAIVNMGTTAYPYPKSNQIFVHYDGRIYMVDETHYLPDKAESVKATPIEIYEIQQQSDLFNSEFVEDYGYSHGTTSDFIYPGQSNAIDGYLIYKVPASLTVDNAYVEIIFDGDDRAVWKLA